MDINLFATRKLTLLYIGEGDYLLDEFNDLFFEKIEHVSFDEALSTYKNHHETSGDFYDILAIEYTDEETFELLKQFCSLNETQLTVLFIDQAEYSAVIQALRYNVDAIIPLPVKKESEIIKPFLKLISIKNNELNLKLSNYLIEQKDKIIDENVYMTISDLDGNIVSVSQAYCDFTGYSKDELIGHNHRIFKHRFASRENIRHLWQTIKAGKKWQGEFKNQKKNGETYIIHSTITPLKSHDSNEIIGYLNIISDVTDIKRLEQLSITDALTNLYNRRYFDFVLQREYKNAKWKKKQLSLMILDIDYFKNYNDYYGHKKGDEALQTIAKLLKQFQQSDVDYVFRIGGEEFALIVLDKNEEQTVQIATKILEAIHKLQIEHKTSEVMPYLTASIGIATVDFKNLSLSFEDLYNLADENLYKAKKEGRNRLVWKVQQETIQKVSNIDMVTKLPNRSALIDQLMLLQNEAMLAIIHVNQIKAIKELYGMEMTQNILQEKTQELQSIIQDKDVTLYNLNLQEYALLVSDQKLFNKYFELIKYYLLSNDKINAAIDSDSSIITSYTVGIAYGIQNIFHEADIALQDALLSNSKLVVYDKNDPTILKQQTRIDQLKTYKKALLEDKIIPYFQPIVDVHEKTIHKFEALARIEDENGDIITPYFFLDSAKQDKTYEYFSRQLVQKVFQIYAKNDVDISLNVTYQNLLSDTMLAYIENRLQKYGGERITFEIVETEEIKDYKKVEEFILMVKKYNAKVSIDDFGSGYSNFTNIIKLNIDYIKLDGTLIEDLLHDKNVENMVKAIISFAKEANIKVIAEFVSSKAIDEKVKALGVDYVQGYLYGEPKPPKEYGLIE